MTIEPDLGVPGRRRLVEHVLGNGLLQLAVLRPDGAPVLREVWYQASFEPDRLHFVSRPDQLHPGDLRLDNRVAGAIVTPPPSGPGEPACAVTLTGAARELTGASVATALAGYLTRWPATTTDPGRLARGETPERVYRVDVTEWTVVTGNDTPPLIIPAAP
ncbi:hypothetical protein [Sphaerisporangium fuscum]|uniref:hypothetical protein n=1 Tax=Sphaerisporangium fuscum TaxID=2835868 RepID=UPI001BDC9CCC|nr:hypothetical protein [Sphaerisporangium fuscum]